MKAFVEVYVKYHVALLLLLEHVIFIFSIQDSGSGSALEGILNTLTHDPIGHFVHGAASVIQDLGHGIDHVAHEISHGIHHIGHEIHRTYFSILRCKN